MMTKIDSRVVFFMEMIAVFKFSLFFVDVCFACIPVLKELICLYCEIQCIEFITGGEFSACPQPRPLHPNWHILLRCTYCAVCIVKTILYFISGV